VAPGPRRSIPLFAALPNPLRHFSVEDFSVRVPNHEEDVKRLEQDRPDTEKIASPNVRCVAL
jgi:hypothetical protein